MAFFGRITDNSLELWFWRVTTAKRRVSVEAKFITSCLISIKAPFNSNLGLFVSIAGVIFFRESIREREFIDILALPS